MSQAQPFQPNLHPENEEGIPAADPGAGAPETAPGFGIGGEAPEEQEDGADELTTAGEHEQRRAEESRTASPDFRTPDPRETRR